MKSFREFMEERVLEYYASQMFPLDFFTAPELDRAFGEAIGEFLYPYLREFKSPVLLELGAGRGLMARDILLYLREKDPELLSRVRYLIYERSPYLIEEQRRVLGGFRNVGWVEEIPPMEGVILSNEFFDALPVHVVRDGMELYVSDEGEEVWLELRNERVRGFLERMGYEGLRQRVEVCLDCIDMLERIGRSLVEGYHLVIDYGYTSEELPKFPEGTVVGYKRHSIRRSVCREKGIDLSAQVNFSVLMEYGKDFGLETVFYESQRNFLLSVPCFLNTLEGLSLEESPEAVERLFRLKTMLISMGERFKVLFQRKVL